MKFKSEQLSLYAITDRNCLRGRNIAEQVEQAILGGVTCIQLREKNLSTEKLVEEAKEVLKICRQYGIPLIINDDYKTAVEIGADGVHVGIEDAPVAEIRRFAGSDFIIGATAKTVEQARFAEISGADYIGVGAVFPSPTKKNAIRITPEQLREICASVNIPAVAIGGITAENVSEIKNCGQRGIAVVSAIFAAEDVKAAAEEFRII
ncbi:MAG: thiamine phosphate synthase [Ruminococcus flavefaciens]|nr:thiamine phosphate synthase [Ruminococcus flavefaciens]MCM1060508.1 thiamine phosphate synthase [Eubacterium sp.]